MTPRSSTSSEPLDTRAFIADDEEELLAARRIHADQLSTFRPAILTIRWGTAGVSLALAGADTIDGGADPAVVIWAAVIVVYTAGRSWKPIRYSGDMTSFLSVLAEVVIHVASVSTTGYWDSPFIFSLSSAVIVAGFGGGFAFALQIGVVSGLAISILDLGDVGIATEGVRSASQWSIWLILVGLIAAYARDISGEAYQQRTQALDRLGRLADANSLLFSLHRVAQTLPASLEMGDVLDTAVARLRTLFAVDFVAIFLRDESEQGWEVLRREGVQIANSIPTNELPPPLLEVTRSGGILHIDDLAESGPGLSGRAGSGMYAPLYARGVLMGLIAIESKSADDYSPRDRELLAGVVEPVALAIDNARLFSHLRTVGADEERRRIARDLHDRIGQSLAYLGFELDRIVNKRARNEDIAPDLEQLRADVRGVTGEVRDTLYDLRTDVSESQSIVDVLREFGERLQERCDVAISFHMDEQTRLPILQEREMWRIAQEALVNIERHSRAKSAKVSWHSDGANARLEIADDGIGFPVGRAGRLDSYGLLGMRERATGIGATLEITSKDQQGTSVVATLHSDVSNRT